MGVRFEWLDASTAEVTVHTPNDPDHPVRYASDCVPNPDEYALVLANDDAVVIVGSRADLAALADLIARVIEGV